MVKYYSISVVLFFSSIFLFSQEKDAKEEARKLAKRAYEIRDSSRYEEAIEILQKASKTDGFTAPEYQFEIAKIYFHKLNKFSKAIKVLKNLCDRPDAAIEHYELLGQSYENDKDYEDATALYKKALEKFPGKGRFYYGLGMTEMRQQKYSNAIIYWEMGLQNEPMEKLNYYALGRLLGSSPERIWGVLYGELYMNINLDSTDNANKEFSKILFNAYQDAFKSGFTRGSNVNRPQTNEKIRLPFPEVYQKFMFKLSDSYLKETTELSISTLYEIRKAFQKKWYENGVNKEFPCMIFDWQNKILEAGHYEAYNYWLFRMGKPDEFEKWKSQNQEKWDSYIEWIKSDPLLIDQSNLFLKKSMN